MGTLYISIILVCRVFQHLFSKRASNAVRTKPCFFKYMAFTKVIAAAMGLILILIAGNGFKCDLLTVLISTFSGIMLVLSSACSMLALRSGTVALSSLFGTAGLIVPCIAGIFLFNAPMSWGQWLGVAIFFVAAYLMITSSSKIACKFTFKTFLLLLGVMFTNGFTMLAQQMFTFYVPEGDVSVFSFLSFGIVGIFMIIMAIITSARSEHTEGDKLTPSIMGMALLLAIAVFIINQLAKLSTAFVSQVVLFTFINGGSTIIAAIVAAVCFRERLTVRSVLGIIIGVASMVIIKAM